MTYFSDKNEQIEELKNALKEIRIKYDDVLERNVKLSNELKVITEDKEFLLALLETHKLQILNLEDKITKLERELNKIKIKYESSLDTNLELRKNTKTTNQDNNLHVSMLLAERNEARDVAKRLFNIFKQFPTDLVDIDPHFNALVEDHWLWD